MFAIPTPFRDALTYLAGWPRRGAAVVCLIAAGVSALGAGHQRPGTAAPVVVARHTIAAGAVLRSGDLALVDWPRQAAPAGSARSPDALLGKRAAAMLPSGLPISPDSLLEPEMAAAAAAGKVSTTVQLGDSGQLAILRPGVQVDLYPRPEQAGLVEPGAAAPVQPVVREARVLSVVPPPASATNDSGPTLVIAIDRAAAGELAGRPAGSLLATLVPPP